MKSGWCFKFTRNIVRSIDTTFVSHTIRKMNLIPSRVMASISIHTVV